MESGALVCDMDDCCLPFAPRGQQPWVREGRRQRGREQRGCVSEGMSIGGSFHPSGYRTFKDYSLRYVPLHWRWAFPQVVSDNRFVEVRPEA